MQAFVAETSGTLASGAALEVAGWAYWFVSSLATHWIFAVWKSVRPWRERYSRTHGERALLLCSIELLWYKQVLGNCFEKDQQPYFEDISQ